MAQIVLMVDDITNEPEAETVDFGLEGKYYKIDLTEEGRDELRSLLRPYIEHAHEAGRMELSDKGVRRPPMPKVSSGRDHAGRHTHEEVQACREWASKLGIQLPPGSGRIPVDIWEAHEADDVSLLRPGRLPEVELTPRQQHMLDLEAKQAS